MLDRSECKKMWVWDGDKENPKDEKRIVIEIFDNGSCLVISKNTEEYFKAKHNFSVLQYDHCEEIQEPKKRLMTRDEVLGFLANESGIVVRTNRYVEPKLPSSFAFDCVIRAYEWARISRTGELLTDWHKFEVEDVD